MSFATGKSAYLINQLNPWDTTITIDRNLGISSGRLYLVNDFQLEWVQFTTNTASGPYYVLGGLTRDIDQVAIPVVSNSTGKTWVANTKVTIVAMHDQLFDPSTGGSVKWPTQFESSVRWPVFATPTARDIAIPSPVNGMQGVYITSLWEYQDYISWAWYSRGTSTPLPTTITWEVRMWTTASAPSWWLICDGSAISRTTYASLFAIIGTTYGAGDGTTTFGIPNMQWRVPVGKNSWTFATLGGAWGEETHVLSESEMPSHNHNLISEYLWWWGWTVIAKQSGVVPVASSSAWIENTWGWLAHNNLQPYLVLNYIIKT